MKKIQYKVLKTLVLAFLVSGMTGIVLADPPADPAHPRKTRDKSTSTTTTTTHVNQSATTTHVAPAPAAARPPQVTHEDHARPDAGRPDFHDNQRDDHHFDHDNGRRDVHYEHDNHGWYDEYHHRHDFVVYRGHRGFWNYENGSPIFVSIDAPLPFSINIHL